MAIAALQKAKRKIHKMIQKLKGITQISPTTEHAMSMN